MVETYELEKPVWTHEDFAGMGWHDSKVWAMLANPDDREFVIDLDYIFMWVNPKADQKYFQFWVAPATMIFENAYDIKVNIESKQAQIEVADLHMENPRGTKNGKFAEYSFRFECQEGEITLTATGYKMYVREKPRLCQGQSMSYAERGGATFDREFNTL